ncbi:hypothetical protein K440DRAFT_658320 [Wilcoxina mikolae CBS 423.85]|nr:hypothetical protein K440DRAFT_658320 [Wilcoxina mikolae CBS 423.85]
MPFYIYGTRGSAHIDHVLLRAPNVQLSADLVNLDELRTMVEEKVFEEELRRGAVVRFVGVSEEAMMPVDEESVRAWFTVGARFECVVFRDDKRGIGKGDGRVPLATGWVTLGEGVWVDVGGLNRVPPSESDRDRLSLNLTRRLSYFNTLFMFLKVRKFSAFSATENCCIRKEQLGLQNPFPLISIVKLY